MTDGGVSGGVSGGANVSVHNADRHISKNARMRAFWDAHPLHPSAPPMADRNAKSTGSAGQWQCSCHTSFTDENDPPRSG
jgi:hypothetical protein